MLQSILDEAWLAANFCTRASLNNEKAKSKGKVRLECAAAVHFMHNKGWEKVIYACLQHPSSKEKLGVGVKNQVGKFCKHVRDGLVLCTVLWSPLEVALET